MREKRHPRIAAFPIGEGGPRQRRSGALVNCRLETHFPTYLSYRWNPIRLAPLATFPTRGRLCVEDSVVLVSLPFPLGKGDRVSG